MFPLSSASQGTAEGGAMSLKPTSTPTASKALNSAAINALSVSELRAGMQQFLRSSGALGSLKTQLRSVIVSELLKRQGPSPRPTGSTAPIVDGNEETDNQENDAWAERLVDALVENHLRQTGRSFSLAIFSTEADISFGTAGDDALAGLLHLNNFGSSLGSRRGSSLLQNVVELHLRHVGDLEGRSGAYTVGTQTDDALDPSASSSPIPLEQRLAAVDAKYALCFARLGHSTREEVDRRLAAYREELRVQMEAAYQQRMRVFEREELSAARRAAEEHYAVLLEHKLAEARAVGTAAVEAAAAERRRLAEARAAVEAAGATAAAGAARLRRELDEALAAAEAAGRRERAAREEARGLALRLQRAEELSAVRLAEGDAARGREWRRVEDLRRLQAEHAAELLLKDEEIGRLRLRLKTLIAAHGAGDKETLNEALTRAAEIQKRVAGTTQHLPYTDPHHREAMWRSAWYATVPNQVTEEIGLTPTMETKTTYREETTSVVPIPQTTKVEEDEKKKDDVVPQNTLPASSPSAQRDVNVAQSVPQASNSLDTVGKSPSVAEDMTQKSVKLEGQEESKSGSSGRNSNSDHMKSGSQETSKKDKSSSSVLTGAESEEKGVSRDNDKTPVRSVASSSSSSSPSSSSKATAASSPSSKASSPSVQSTTTSLRSEEEKNRVKTITAETDDSAAAASLVVKLETLLREEEQARNIIVQEEDTSRRGITWAAKSQHNVLLQREKAENEDSNNDDAQGVSSLGAYISSARQQQHQLVGGGLDTLYSEDDSNSGNSILFGRRGSSEESF
ncbi:hypothetical protein LSM04_006346 [Trypanosoma melophagium]|uniref:uncharacterized protein n=1 Tax=Trypanosoma melophagium TaxID=715481 RepID=UPI00351A6808|nr:hypothetical protein LSM04_006346 [Trypanosoma melophagium]